jgi:hypothetical protein
LGCLCYPFAMHVISFLWHKAKIARLSLEFSRKSSSIGIFIFNLNIFYVYYIFAKSVNIVQNIEKLSGLLWTFSVTITFKKGSILIDISYKFTLYPLSLALLLFARVYIFLQRNPAKHNYLSCKLQSLKKVQQANILNR